MLIFYLVFKTNIRTDWKFFDKIKLKEQLKLEKVKNLSKIVNFL